MLAVRITRVIFILLLGSLVLSHSSLAPADEAGQVRAFTRPLEFDYVSWIFNAIGVKVMQFSLGASEQLRPDVRKGLVLDYLQLVDQIRESERLLYEIYANPGVADPLSFSLPVRQELERLYDRRARLGPLAESILQSQLSETVTDLDLTLGGQPLPPILYHSTPLPTALIVSPRDAIRQDANISLVPELTADERTALEEQVDQALNVSSLVVDIGGIGVYPTMVVQTSNLNFLTEVVAHEWIHNYLTLRPLGFSYTNSPELRTMNETAASIAGKEIGLSLLKRYYPELVPPPPPPPAPPPPPGETPEPQPPVFDFRAEMRETRVTVDGLLAEGKIEEAENYMEERRVFFWENGYLIRKLNQAYFAFHGAYADEPGGAAGEDPVGAAVRALRAESPSLAAFIKTISWMSSYEDLQRAVDANRS
jgi:hypothetical protein